MPGIIAAEMDGTVNEVEDVNVPGLQALADLRPRMESGASNGSSFPRFSAPADRAEVWGRVEPSVADAVAADGYPALLLYTTSPRGSNDKKSITFYDGVRDVPSILDFLLVHSSKLKREHLLQ